jgi:hypothetical protein
MVLNSTNCSNELGLALAFVIVSVHWKKLSADQLSIFVQSAFSTVK